MRTRPWEVDDALWAGVQPHIPPQQLSLRGGRVRVDDRACFGAILYVLRTGCQWNALPKEAGCSSSTAHRRFQEWRAGGFFEERLARPKELNPNGAEANEMRRRHGWKIVGPPPFRATGQ